MHQQRGKLRRRARQGVLAAATLALAATPALALQPASAAATRTAAAGTATATPIKHLVIIYDENHSFDNYFGTYPRALNPPGEPAFQAAPGTPAVNGLTPALLNHNPNLANPFRLDRSQEDTCDNNHGYTPLQAAYDNGKLDQFVQKVGPTGAGCDPTLTMGYYDGNTVTALWQYAQHFAMSDNNFDDTYGPSNPSIVNLISGQTHGAVPTAPTSAVANGTMIANINPSHDDCGSGGASTVEMTGKNIGDLLNAKGVTWGWFNAGFAPTSVSNGTATCATQHTTITGHTSRDYGGGNDPFMYYAATDNPHHLPPSSAAMIGHTDQANHQYDMSDFWTAADQGNLPAVSFLRAGTYQQAHPTSSDPLDEQDFLVSTINRLEQLPSWQSTAVAITYDESDGWYDNVMPPIVNDSQSAQDVLTGPGTCGTGTPKGGFQDRCGFGPRIPLLLISPYARANFVSHSRTAQTALIRFAETNWHLGSIGGGSLDVTSGSIEPMFNFGHPSAGKLILDPSTGEPVAAGAPTG
ncbi:MAG: alkaline phosphatase family protein [Actinobacteria bacterium]|nr:alkaline phosphatase family protein [Actinomycetota bacterium]